MKAAIRHALVAAVLCLVACRPGRIDDAPRVAPGYLKGQLHLHSASSADSRTPAAEVVRWYEERGYDFIVFTDHNHAGAPSQTRSMLVLPGVELTQNLRGCTPPSDPGDLCLLHVNALFLAGGPGRAIPWRMPSEGDRLTLYGNALDTARLLGGLAQLNHPNFHHAVGASTIEALVRRHGLRFFEVANGSFDAENEGDARHPSTEALWDQVLSSGVRIFGTATDDAHHYYDAEAVAARGEQVFTGDRGFVMVKASRDAGSIREALLRGDFYASSGVVLDRSEISGGEWRIDAAGASHGRHVFSFIGSGGRVLQRSQGRSARFALGSAPPGYVRAVVEDARGRKAWLQPVDAPAAR